MSRLLNHQITPGLVECLVRDQRLDKATGERLLENLWKEIAFEKSLRFLMLTLGTTMAVVGAFLLFAYNWQEVPRLLKLGLCQGLVLSAAIAATCTPKETRLHRLFLAATALFIGLALAVHGQAYNMGAELHNLYLSWSIFSLPMVWLAGFEGLWIFWALLANGALTLFLTQVALPNNTINMGDALLLIGGLNALFLGIAESGIKGFLQLGEAGKRLMWGIMLAAATIPTMILIWGYDIDWSLWDYKAYGITFVVMGAGYFIYRKRKPDFIKCALIHIAIGGVIGVILMRVVVNWLENDLSSTLFFSGLIVAAIVIAEGETLRRLHRKMSE